MPVLDAQRLIDNRCAAIHDFHKDVGTMKAELDLSGGVDSAVMAYLLVEALGADNVVLVHSRFSTAHEQTKRATYVADALGCPLINGAFGGTWEVLFSEVFHAIEDAYGQQEVKRVVERCEQDPTILGSIRSTLRAPIGRGFNRLLGGGIRHGTGNECEDRWLRFYQKGGDGEVDTNPLAMLSKGEVYQLAVALGVPRAIIAAKPTPDLWGVGSDVKHTDEDELLSWTGVPFTYSRVSPETSEYIRVGTIERVSRLLDQEVEYPDGNVYSFGGRLFGVQEPEWGEVGSIAAMFSTFEIEEAIGFLKAARLVERITRHKENPRIPALGSRADLLQAEILTNELPDVDESKQAVYGLEL